MCAVGLIMSVSLSREWQRLVGGASAIYAWLFWVTFDLATPLQDRRQHRWDIDVYGKTETGTERHRWKVQFNFVIFVNIREGKISLFFTISDILPATN